MNFLFGVTLKNSGERAGKYDCLFRTLICIETTILIQNVNEQPNLRPKTDQYVD